MDPFAQYPASPNDPLQDDVAIPMDHFNPGYVGHSFREPGPPPLLGHPVAENGLVHRGRLRHDSHTEELLESLPSRQLEAMISGSGPPRSVRGRHKRNKSFHGAVHVPHGEFAPEDISRQLEQDEDLMEAPREEVDHAIRDMTTATLSNKRAIRNKLSSRKQHRKLGRCEQLSYNAAMAWQHFKYNIKEMAYSLELWKSHLKTIEGHFGTGVLSYFLFLKWLFFINIPTMILALGFIVIPQVLVRWLRNSPPGYPPTNLTFTGIELLTGAGWFRNTELYYGFYTNETLNIISNHHYNMKYAYLFTCGGYILLCLIILSQSILRSYRKYYLEGSSDIHFYAVRKALVGWDYGITSLESANLKKKSIYNELKEFLSGTKAVQAKSLGEKCQLFFIRVATNLFVLGLCGGSGYLIYFISSNPFLRDIESNELRLLAMPLVLSAIHIVAPFIFSLVERLEQYELPRTELYVHLARSLFVRMVNIGVLVYFWFTKKAVESKDNCWESFVGQDIYRLVIVDFLVTLLETFFLECCRKLMSMCCPSKLRPPEFAIGRNTLDLIYTQALCWLGTFYSPLLSVIMLVKLVIIFYVKRLSVMKTCSPSIRPWRAARSHTIFMFFLFCFFLLTMAAVACGIIFVQPSTDCGPYIGANTTYQVVTDLVFQWKDEIPGLATVIEIVSSSGFIAVIIILLSMGTYYMRIAMVSHKEMVNLLQEQLKMEGKDKKFLLNILQEVNRRNKHRGRQPRETHRPSRPVTGGAVLPGVTSPGGRAFVRSMAEAVSAGMSSH